jgi:general secretion pathway protein F
MEAVIARSGPPTLDDLAALNREMAALIGAGLPLEPGLKSIAADYHGRPGRLAARLAERTAAGMPLPEAIAAEGDALPAAYRAVVDAGLRSGRLSAALEGFAETAARIAEMRRITAQAVIYPLLVLSLAWVITVFMLTKVIPRYETLDLENRLWAPALNLSKEQRGWLAISVPAAFFVFALIWWVRTRGAPSGRLTSRFIQWIPGVRRAVRLSEQANFADLLATLLRSAVPMTEALPLAARASGVADLVASATEAAERISSGAPLTAEFRTLRQLPPLVRTALLSVESASEAQTVESLQRAADVYRERSTAWVADFAVLLPVTLTVLVGLGVVGMYALVLMQPYFTLLRELVSWS